MIHTPVALIYIFDRVGKATALPTLREEQSPPAVKTSPTRTVLTSPIFFGTGHSVDSRDRRGVPLCIAAGWGRSGSSGASPIGGYLQKQRGAPRFYPVPLCRAIHRGILDSNGVPLLGIAQF